MAYQVQRQKKIQEDIELLDKDGNVAFTLHVDINPAQMRDRYIKQMSVITKVNNAGNDMSLADRIELSKDAVMALFNLVFGEKQTEDLVKYYEGDITGALVDIIPFINDVVSPAMKAASLAEKMRIQELMGR